MFRDDRVLVERDVYEVVEGEAIHKDREVIANDIPAHLSVSLNNTSKINNVPYIVSEYTLYLDSNIDFEIKENDILTVTTKRNEIYKLTAGKAKIYNLSCQVKCSLMEIIET